MDAKEIKNIGWNKKKRIDLPGLPEFIEISMQCLYGVRSHMRRNRVKTDSLRSVRLDFCNLIVGRFPLASFSGKELIKVSMELQHNAGCKRDVGVVSVDCIKNVPVTGNFLLGAVLRIRLFGNQILNTFQGGGDSY